MPFRLTSTSYHATIYRAVEAEERVIFDTLAKRVTFLEGELEKAMKLACDNLKKAADARKEQVQQGEACNAVLRKLLDDLSKMMARNLELTSKVGKLKIDLDLAEQETLIALHVALMAQGVEFPVPSEEQPAPF